MKKFQGVNKIPDVKGQQCPLNRRVTAGASTPPKKDMAPACTAFHNRFNGKGT